MAPLSKENEVLTIPPTANTAGSTTAGARHEDTSTSKPQPVALEVPVTVNGARTVEGSDKREPFSETTKTVLVFGTGAVIRLGSPVAAGQLLFLTNEKTKKEVVCQVVKSKNYRNVSGYVELEFTESVVGFWGMRFPTDRIGTHAPVVSTATPAKGTPVAPSSIAQAPSIPAIPVAPKIPVPPAVHIHAEAKTEVQVRPTPVEVKAVPVQPILVTPPVQATPIPAAPPTPLKKPEVASMPAPTLSSSLASSISSVAGASESPSIATPVKPAAPQSALESHPVSVNGTADNSTEQLKQQTARLQEQLSSLLFDAAAPKPSAPVPALDSKAISGVAATVVEMAKPEAAPIKAAPSAKIPASIKSSLDSEEVKIPSWLEPLARNTAASTTSHDHSEREKSKHAPEVVSHEEHAAEHAPAHQGESAPEVAMPMVGSMFQLDDSGRSHQDGSTSSRKGLWIGAAVAAVALAAAGAWYELAPANSVKRNPPSSATPASATTSTPAASTNAAAQPDERPAQRNEAAEREPASSGNEAPRSSAPAHSEPITKSPSPAQPVPVTRDNSKVTAATIPAAVKERIARQPAPTPEPEVKKPALGEVHLASPTMNHTDATQGDQVVAPTLATGNANSGEEGIGSGLASGSSKQPELPVPVGGDVKPAVLISHVAPTYPALALNQHVTGEVVIDALIDATGHVTTMKVISGPTLLHQAAKDALRQWKYQPATLDGNAVSMHLTVKLQFRM